MGEEDLLDGVARSQGDDGEARPPGPECRNGKQKPDQGGGCDRKYEGEWKNDMFNGEGRLVFEDGGIYEGEWKNDRKHGLGRLTDHDGKKHIGYFFEDEFLGFPSDTYILDNVELTDDLREWGFRNVSISVSYTHLTLPTIYSV